MAEELKGWDRTSILSELFRFRSASTEYFEDELLRAVKKQEYYFSPITSLNDPFDCNPVMAVSSNREILEYYKNVGRRFLISEETVRAHHPGSSDKCVKKLLKDTYSVNFGNVQKTRQSFRAMFEAFRQESKAICLTEEWESPLHWAHYAAAHSGIAYRFKVDIQTAEYTNDDLPLAMRYVSDRPSISDIDLLCWLEGSDFPKHPDYKDAGDNAFNALNFTKSVEWSYEKEWRVQKRFFGSAAYKFTPALKVDAIILGTRCTAETTDIVVQHCANHCDVYRASLDAKRFRLVKDKL